MSKTKKMIFKNLSLKNISGEKWKFITGTDKHYMVSNLGRVKSIGRRINNFFYIKDRILSQAISGKYLRVGLGTNKSKKLITKMVHRLVANEFCKNKYNKPYVNHLNGNPQDNRAINLEWCTQSENVIHSFVVLKRKSSAVGRIGYKNVLSKKVNQYTIDGVFIKTHDAIASAYRSLGIKKSGTIYSAAKNSNLSAFGFKWAYVN